MKTSFKKLSPKTSLNNKRVLLRVDFNVPLVKNGREWTVVDNWRLIATLPTLRDLVARGAVVVIISHLGRPNGQWQKKLSVKPLAAELGKLMPEAKIVTATHFNFEKLRLEIDSMPAGSIFMTENIRFLPGEEANDKQLAKSLATLGELYINEAFSVSHRKHASVFGLPKLMPSYAGEQWINEVKSLNKLVTSPRSPFVLLVGGAKVHEKLAIALQLSKNVNVVLTGGIVANTLLEIAGYKIGKSRVDTEAPVKTVKKMLTEVRSQRGLGEYSLLQLPDDVLVNNPKTDTSRVVDLVAGETIKATEIITDIGPKTIDKYRAFMAQANTLVWNGPVGLIEDPIFDHGSRELTRVFAARADGKAFGLVGGGDTMSVFNKMGLAHQVDFCSTGGGAMLDYLGGKRLPGLEVLK